MICSRADAETGSAQLVWPPGLSAARRRLWGQFLRRSDGACRWDYGDRDDDMICTSPSSMSGGGGGAVNASTRSGLAGSTWRLIGPGDLADLHQQRGLHADEEVLACGARRKAFEEWRSESRRGAHRGAGQRDDERATSH